MKNKASFAKRFLIFALLFVLAAQGCSSAPKPLPEPSAEPTQTAESPSEEPFATPYEIVTFAPTEEPTPAPTEDPVLAAAIAAALDGMTMEEKVGQLVMFSFDGRGGISPAFIELIDKYPVGNVLFSGLSMDKNDGSGGFDSAAGYVKELETKHPCPVPRLFAVDAEGGSVVRFKWEPAIPSAYELSRKSPEEVRELFRGVGEKLRSCGINLDLAPVCDIAEDPLATSIGDRIFSSDLETVNSMTAAVIGGLHEGGCSSCAKHFPGHGATEEDSHKGTPVVSKSASELYDYDIAAFASAIEAGADCVMAAHVLYPAFDEGDIASMSHIILTGLLRGELRFRGVIISDDMMMEGLTSSYPLSEAALKFILSGGDMLLCSGDAAAQEEILLALYHSCETRIITEERLNASVTRVLKLKYERGVWQP